MVYLKQKKMWIVSLIKNNKYYKVYQHNLILMDDTTNDDNNYYGDDAVILPLMSYKQRMRLKVRDKIDYRGNSGKFYLVEIISEKGIRSTINCKYDDHISRKETYLQQYQVAKPGSISNVKHKSIKHRR